jgi:excinuclease ABC subunit A
LARREHAGRLYILDEPTTGLGADDVERLLALLFRLRDAGATLIVVEHHLDVVKAADWTLELGPGGGPEGGQLVFAGTQPNSPRPQPLRDGHFSAKPWFNL